MWYWEMGMQPVSYVVVCESTLQALRNCPVVKQMWDEIVPNNFTNVFMRVICRIGSVVT